MMKTVKLIKKEYLEKNDVYDIEVNKTHSYILENGIVSHNSSLEYTPSYIIAMTKSKLKEDEDGNKTTDVHGIKVNAVVRKTRYTKPFQKVSFTIPYETGMNPYSGLFDLFSEGISYNGKPLLVKEGNQYSYYSVKTNEQVFKKFRKNITNEDYDLIMKEYTEVSSSEKAIDDIINKAEKTVDGDE